MLCGGGSLAWCLAGLVSALVPPTLSQILLKANTRGVANGGTNTTQAAHSASLPILRPGLAPASATRRRAELVTYIARSA